MGACEVYYARPDVEGDAIDMSLPDRHLNLFDSNGIFTMTLRPRWALVLHIKSSF